MAVNDFLPFATDVGANVVTQAEYLASDYVGTGRQAGVLPSAVYNKIARQGNFMAAALAQYIVDQTGLDVLDDGDLSAMVDLISQAIVIGSGVKPVRVITVSATVVVALTDYRLVLNRTAGVAALAVNLPAGALVGQEFVVVDVVGNLQPAPATVTPPSGTIAGLANFVMNENRQSQRFVRVTADLWSVE